jgi:hypothetical protein
MHITSEQNSKKRILCREFLEPIIVLSKSFLKLCLVLLLVGLGERNSQQALPCRTVVLFGAVYENDVFLVRHNHRLNEDLDVY